MPPDPDQLLLLTSTRTEFEAQTIATALEAEGIPVRVFAAASHGVQWEGGIANSVRVMVRRADAAMAAEALHRIRRDSRAIDWSQVDVGPPEDENPVLPPPSSRINGWSPLFYRIRIVGFTLLFSMMLLQWMGVRVAIPALLIAIVFIIAGWTPPDARPAHPFPRE
ncbi:hypothetical protein PHYC_03559 [Phycisphaerales bacterium]|nr:hypothetical protein PHYC_03559 [Phycisphaerales bacterium]